MELSISERRAAAIDSLVAEVGDLLQYERDTIIIALENVPVQHKVSFLKAVLGKARLKAAVKTNCLLCSGWEKRKVMYCDVPTCPLYQYRPRKE